MADDRYNRWQGLANAQLSVAVALMSGLSVAGLGAGLSLLRQTNLLLSAPFNICFAVSLFLLIITVFLSCGSVITRTLDFRLTARKVRLDIKSDYNKPLKIFWLGREGYGRATWGLFWCSCFTFTAGVVLLVISISAAYADRL